MFGLASMTRLGPWTREAEPPDRRRGLPHRHRRAADRRVLGGGVRGAARRGARARRRRPAARGERRGARAARLAAPRPAPAAASCSAAPAAAASARSRWAARAASTRSQLTDGASAWARRSPPGRARSSSRCTGSPARRGCRARSCRRAWSCARSGARASRCGGEAATEEWLGHRPGQLLKYLVCERGRVVPLEELLEVFWPHAGRAGASSVRQAIHTLRDRLEPDRPRGKPSGYVVARAGGYELAPGRVAIDADDFEARARAGLEALQRGATRARRADAGGRRAGLRRQLPRRRAVRGVGAGRARAPARPRRAGPARPRGDLPRRRATRTPPRSTCSGWSSSSRSTSRPSATCSR